jgi:Meiotically up-regulated gene family
MEVHGVTAMQGQSPTFMEVFTVWSPVLPEEDQDFSPATNYALLTTSVHIDIASDPSQPYGTANILSGFNNTSQNSLKATATCQLNAQWPATYGDVYFGADGCLYDSSSNKILDQCCGPPDPNNSGLITNPYCAPAPPSPSQVTSNNHGSSICLSINSDSCKSGAQRFQDNTVYHQYTSSVWPNSIGTDITAQIFAIDPFNIVLDLGEVVVEMFGIYYGCTVIWACDNSDAYHQGMTGAQIKDA